MKAAVGVLSIGALGGVLQGCGGGGGGDGGSKSNPPFHSTVDFVSQKVTMDIKGTSSAQTPISEGFVNVEGTTTGISTDAVDFEKWLFFQDTNLLMHTESHSSFAGITEVATADLRTEAKVVVDANAQSFVMYSKITNETSGAIIQKPECKVMDGSEIPPVSKLQMLWTLFKPQIQQRFKWESSDGTYDTFKGGYKGPIPSFIPVKMTGEVDIDTTVSMDKDFLLHSVIQNQILNTSDNNVASKESATVTAASLGGPTPEDMDYTKWPVPCEQATKEEANAVMAKLVQHQKQIPGASLKLGQFFAAFQAAQERSKQVVV